MRPRRRVVHRIYEAWMQCIRANFAILVDGQETHLQRLARGWPLVDHTVDGCAAGFRWRAPLTHQFHNKKTGGVADHLLADARCSSGANIVVGVETGADDRAVGDATVHLPCDAAGAAGTRELALRIECHDAQSVVIVLVARYTGTCDIHHRTVL